MRPAPGPPRGRRRKKDRERVVVPAVAKPKDLPPVPANVTLTEAVTVKELAEKLNRKSKDVIAKLITQGVLATINQPLEPDVAVALAKEFGSEAKIISFEEEAQHEGTPVAELEPGAEPIEEEDSGNLEPRAPVVTVMGHVDHGKTSLLDAIRATDVAGGEAGGITQHIGAYQVHAGGRQVTFLDTPGHEAFTLMRARGSKVTDVVVLMVAADDGVKPQTLEAIDHARAAGVPMVVAINKIDKPNAQPDRVKQQLAEHEVVIEEYGGDTVACEISAKQRTGIEALLEMILLVADLKELRANPNRHATGVVLETRLDRARGIVSTVLVQNGTLRIGDPFIAGATSGKVRAMADEHGQRAKEAGPSVPVEVTGFATEPAAGDNFQAVGDEARARQIAAFRREKVRAATQAGSARRSLESLSRQVAAGEVRELPIILRCDAQGSAEALQKSLNDLPSDKIRINVIRTSIGAITRADVLLATASNAIIVGFNVRPDRPTSELAKQEEVELRLYTVIYDLLQDIQQAMIGMLAPTEREQVLGQAQVRQTFKVPKIGIIAGCYVTDGKVARNAEVRLLRDNVVIYTGKVGSLKRFKDDASEVKQGYECGIGIAGYNDVKEDDVIEFFVVEKVAAQTL
jgi:translation initiation factor IF-2